MLPVEAPQSYLRRHSLSEREVIRDVMEVKPRLFLILLDMCLKVPGRSEYVVLCKTRRSIQLFHEFSQCFSNPDVY
jgi:hypothetical protein